MKKIAFIICLTMLVSAVFAEEHYLNGDRGPGDGMVFYYSEAGF